MATTKEKIIEQAKILFDQKGYSNVSLREIAKAAGTTIGNLTYHFHQKEDLILSMQNDLYADYLHEYVDQLDTNDEVLILQKLIQSFYQAKKNREDNSFFYRNIVELSHHSTIIAQNIKDFQSKNYSYYFSSFLHLRKYKIMRSDITKAQYEVLAYTMVSMSYLWLQDATPYYGDNIPSLEIDYGLTHLIYPYLTSKGTQLYTQITQNHKKNI